MLTDGLNIQNFINRIRVFWLISTILVCLLVVSSEFLVRNALDGFEDDTATLLDLGLQRLATQRMALLAQRIASETDVTSRQILTEQLLVLVTETQGRLDEFQRNLDTYPIVLTQAVGDGLQTYLDTLLSFSTIEPDLTHPALLAIQQQTPTILATYNEAIAYGVQHRAESLRVLRSSNQIRVLFVLTMIVVQTVVVVFPLLRRIHAKGQLLEQQKRFIETVGATLPDIIIIVELATGRFIYSNEQIPLPENAIAYTMQRLHPEDYPAYQELLRHCGTLTKGEVFNTELRYMVGNDQFRRMLIRYTPFHFDKDGKPDQILTISQDVTALRQAEERQKMLELEQDRAMMLQEFIRNTSHDLRTPLTSIQNQAELMVVNSEQEGRHARLLKIREQVQRILRVLEQQQQLVTLDQLTELDVSPQSLNGVVQGVIQLFKVRAAAKGLILQENYAAEIMLPVDSCYLEIAIGAVLDNALRVSPYGSTVIVRTFTQDGQAVIEVEDHGSGISADALPHVFERFYKGNQSRTSDGSSSGLGLSVTQRVMGLHGGRAEIFRTDSTGTIVRLHLPV